MILHLDAIVYGGNNIAEIKHSKVRCVPILDNLELEVYVNIMKSWVYVNIMNSWVYANIMNSSGSFWTISCNQLF